MKRFWFPFSIGCFLIVLLMVFNLHLLLYPAVTTEKFATLYPIVSSLLLTAVVVVTSWGDVVAYRAWSRGGSRILLLGPVAVAGVFVGFVHFVQVPLQTARAVEAGLSLSVRHEHHTWIVWAGSVAVWGLTFVVTRAGGGHSKRTA